MKWVVALDLGARSSGAIRFAHWLAAMEPDPRFIGVHVLEQEHLLAVLRDHHLDEVLTGARKAAEASVAGEGASSTVVAVDVVQALNAPEGLRDSATRLNADGILLGRAAPREGGGLVRLGRVARRLLRITTLPVVVVPPDMKEADFGGDGPVIALTNLDDGSVEPCRFAQTMARALRRPLVVAHAVEESSVAAVQYVAVTTLERISAERLAEASSALSAWIARVGLQPDATEILSGNVVDEATAFASRRRAALVVAGSRHASTLERLLLASTASELAAAATRPVAIVPPPRA